MDSVSNVGGYLGIIVTVGGIVFAAVNHKRLRSNCCGRKIDVSIDVEATNPSPTVDKGIQSPKDKTMINVDSSQ